MEEEEDGDQELGAKEVNRSSAEDREIQQAGIEEDPVRQIAAEDAQNEAVDRLGQTVMEEDSEVEIIGEISAEDAEKEALQRQLRKLEALCKVLGSNYQEKIDEIGGFDDEQQIDGERIEERNEELGQAIRNLQRAKERRFQELRQSGNLLINEWKMSSASTTKLHKFIELFATVDAISSDEITEERYLSKSLLDRVRAEIKRLKSDKESKEMKEYLSKQNRLLNLLQEGHLKMNLGFDPAKEVTYDELPDAMEIINKLLITVERDVFDFDRREIVLRIEMLHKAVEKRIRLAILERMIRATNDLMQHFTSCGDMFMYDGVNGIEVLKDLHQKAMCPPMPTKKLYKGIQRAAALTTSRTRSGRIFGDNTDSSFPHHGGIPRKPRTGPSVRVPPANMPSAPAIDEPPATANMPAAPPAVNEPPATATPPPASSATPAANESLY